MSSSSPHNPWPELLIRMNKLQIFEHDLLEKFVLGSGAGGQKINKSSTCVFLKHLPSGHTVKCQAERSRELNRLLARRQLCDLFDSLRHQQSAQATHDREKARRQSRPLSQRSKQRSIEAKRSRSQQKALRKRPSSSD